MCGFAGVVAWEDRFRVTRETLARMSARIAHRGPDGEGLYLNHEEQVRLDRPQVGLVHRRLAILDPDPRANQPFSDHLGRWIVFNGEIYNFRELCAELSKLNPEYAWRTNGDTEALLVAYDVWGEKCVEHLNGMFAFAVWDQAAGTLTCAVDRMGQKPLYWAAVTPSGDAWTGMPDAKEGRQNEVALDAPLGAVAFASELSALQLLPWVTHDLDAASLSAYMRWGYIPAPQTIFASVRKFCPADAGIIGVGRVSVRRYFDPNAAGVTGAERGDMPMQVRSLFTQAVNRQLVSDVPIGCFLSGGVDSSLIAWAMQRALSPGQKIQTFTIGFDDPAYDESSFAAAVAEHLGTEHRCLRVQPTAVEDLPRLAAVFGEPFGDSSALPTHYLARETRQFVKVALSGDGGDELFGGYDRYRAVRMAAAFDRMPAAVRRTAASEVWQRLPGSHPKSRFARLKRFLRSAAFPDALRRYLAITSLFDDGLRKELLRDSPLAENHQADWEWVALGTRLLAHRDPVQTVLALDRLTYLPGDLLTKVDRASMLHALEVRSPFMDHELVHFAAGLTTDQLLRGGPKRMLREAFAQDLPAWVFKRKKMGFAVPIGEWFRGELRPMLRDHLFASDSFASSHFNRATVERLVDEHERRSVDHAQRLYALLMLELWWKTSNG